MITQEKIEQFIKMRNDINYMKSLLNGKFKDEVIEVAHHIMFEKNNQVIVMKKHKFERNNFNDEIFELISSFDEQIFKIKKRSSGRIIMENDSIVLFSNERDVHLRGRNFTLIYCENDDVLLGHPYKKCKNNFFTHMFKGK